MLLCLMASEHCDLIPTQFLRGKKTEREERPFISFSNTTLVAAVPNATGERPHSQLDSFDFS